VALEDDEAQTVVEREFGDRFFERGKILRGGMSRQQRACAQSEREPDSAGGTHEFDSNASEDLVSEKPMWREMTIVRRRLACRRGARGKAFGRSFAKKFSRGNFLARAASAPGRECRPARKGCFIGVSRDFVRRRSR
jgi:hypothetical protein